MQCHYFLNFRPTNGECLQRYPSVNDLQQEVVFLQYLVVQILHLILLERVVPAGNDSLGPLVSSNLATSIILLFHRTDNY